LDSAENPRKEGETIMSLESRFLDFLKETTVRIETRRKKLEDFQKQAETSHVSHYEKPALDVLKIIARETINRDEEGLAMLILFTGFARYIDQLEQAMKAVQERLQQIGGTESKINAIEELAKKHDEIYQAIDKMIQKAAEAQARDKEITYVQ
jgi:hypothetical protein